MFPINNISAKERSHININTAPPEMLSCLVPSSLKQNVMKNSLKIHNLKKGKKAEKPTGSTQDLVNNLLCHSKDPDNPEQQDPSSWFDKKSWVFNINATGKQESRVQHFQLCLKEINLKIKKDKASKGLVQRSYQILSSKIL